MKLYLDEDISPKVSEILRTRGVDALSAHETGMIGASDAEQLAFAVAEKRAMVTRNRDDFVSLTVQSLEGLSPHAGLVIIPHTIAGFDFNGTAESLLALVKNHPQGLAPYAIEFLSNKK